MKHRILGTLGAGLVLVSCLALIGCGDNPAAPTASPEPSATPPSVVYDVHVFAFSGRAVDPSNAITEVDQGQQFKVGLTAQAYDVATGAVLPGAVPPLKVTWRQKNVPVGLCVDRGALDSIVEQEVCWESTGVDKATFEGCAKSILDGRQVGCAEYGVTVR